MPNDFRVANLFLLHKCISKGFEIYNNVKEYKLKHRKCHKSSIEDIAPMLQLIAFFLDENKHPQAYQAKLQELIDSGMSEIDARKYIAHTPIQLELIYEVNEGFFAIEPDATECEIYNSPYSKKLIKVLG